MRTDNHFSIDPLTTSFRELKAMVGSTAGQKLPSARKLHEDGGEILFSYEHGDTTLTVFASGFFLYECYDRKTVSAVDRCKEIIYQYQDGEIRRIEEAEFRDGPCLIPLLMAGDDRVAHNLDSYEWYWHEFSLDNDGEDWTKEASTMSAEDEYLHSEDISQVREEMDGLTERQQQIVRLYYCEGKSQYEIASLLHIGRSRVQKVLNASLRRMRRDF